MNFLKFSAPARRQLELHPEDKEWLLRPAILNPVLFRGAEAWQLAWHEATGLAELDEMRCKNALLTVYRRECLRIGLMDFAGFLGLEAVLSQLSDLADFCINQAVRFAWNFEDISVIALNELGGKEFSYRSDLDLQFFYGEKDEPHPIEHQNGLSQHDAITHKVDKLRAILSCDEDDKGLFQFRQSAGHSSSPVCSLDNYVNQYGAFAPISVKLRLLKARLCAGQVELGSEFIQWRDHFCYLSHLTEENIKELAELKKGLNEQPEIDDQDLRQRSTGCLQQIGFMVQALQLLHASHTTLRQTGTWGALESIRLLNLLPLMQVAEFTDAYIFWRHVKNRLEMAGSREMEEYEIADCLGFTLSDFKDQAMHHASKIRTLLSDLITIPAARLVPALLLSQFPDRAQAEVDFAALLPEGAPSLSGSAARKAFTRLWPALSSGLQRCTRPNAALSRLTQFIEVSGSRSLIYESLATHTKTLHLLLSLLDQSAYFSAQLQAQPDLFEQITQNNELHVPKTKSEYLSEMAQLKGEPIRSYVCGEHLRIFAREVTALGQVHELEEEFTALTEACLEAALVQSKAASSLAWIGLGRWGGGDLTYGSELEVVILGEDEEAAQKVVVLLKNWLPHGLSFPFVSSHSLGNSPICLPFSAYKNSLFNDTSLPTVLALNSARFLGGDFSLADAFLIFADQLWQQAGEEKNNLGEVDALRDRIEQENTALFLDRLNFKAGRGGWLDIECGIQKFLLARGHREPNLQVALEWMKRVHPAEAETWQEGLFFLRRIENVLNRDHFSDTSWLPNSPSEQQALAASLGFASSAEFLCEYQAKTVRIRAEYEKFRQQPA